MIHHVWMLIFLTTQLVSFDVKVLLKKVSMPDLAQNTQQIQSQSGFLLSHDGTLASAYVYDAHELSIAARREQLLINNRLYNNQSLYVYPKLSCDQEIKIQTTLICWLDMQGDMLSDYFASMNKVMLHACSSSGTLSVDEQKTVRFCFDQVLMAAIKATAIPDIAMISDEKLLKLVQSMVMQCPSLLLEQIRQHPVSAKVLKKMSNGGSDYLDYCKPIWYSICKEILSTLPIHIPSSYLTCWYGMKGGMFTFDGVSYQGSCIIYYDKGSIYIINNVELDDYLYSVIRYEGFPGWPDEMNRLLAIMCRSYLVHQVLCAKKLNRPYHIENGIKHQRYHGHHEHVYLKQALESTKDIFIGYQGKPALAMYDSCCGGIIPAYIDDPEYKKIPYLARTYPCTFCKGYKAFSWSFHLSEKEVIARLSKEFPRLTKVVDMFVSKKDKAGLMQRVTIVGPHRRHVITEKKLKTFFPEIKSYGSSMHKEGSSFHFAGKGFGHHKGLCQWGAMHLIKHEGWKLEQVLQFYYPGTHLMKLVY